MTDKLQDKIEEIKSILASDLEVAFQQSAATAISGRPTTPFTKRTGHLVGDIRSRKTTNGIEVSFPFYAEYLEYGTGIYGPKKTRIKPKSKKALAFGKTIKGNQKEFVFKSVAGIRPSPFIRPVIHNKFIPLLQDAIREAFK